MNVKTKGILSIIGASLLHILIGSYHTWSRLMDYYISYLHYNDHPSLTLSNSTSFTPFIRLIYTFFLSIGIVITSKIGIYIPCIISIVFLIISHLILLYSVTSFFIVFAFIIYGIGIGLSYMSVILNSWSYYPKRKGIIIGIILTCFGSSSFVFKFIADLVINPEGVEVNSGTGFYDKEVSDNILSYIKLLIVVFIIFGFFGIGVINPWNNQLIAETSTKNSMKEYRYNSNLSYYQLLDLNNEDNETIKTTVTSYFGGAENLKVGLKSKPFYQLVIMFMLSNLFNSLHISDNVTLGEKKNKDFLSNNILIWNIANGLFRIFWGFILDTFNFKSVYLFCLFLQIMTFSTFYFIAGINSLFYLYNFFTALANSCSSVIVPYSFYKIFGMKNGGIYFGISQFVSSIVSFGIPFLIDFLSGSDIDYMILFLGNSVSKMLASIVLCFIEEKRYDYGMKEKENLIKSRISTSSMNSSNSNV